MSAEEHLDTGSGPGPNEGSAAGKRAMDSPETAGTVIGRYHLLQKIGEGGMGEVWLAGQKEPVRRRVAVKLVKAGMNTREVIARFESERQALVLMDHPAIAKVLDAGSTPQGAPYFVKTSLRRYAGRQYFAENQSRGPSHLIPRVRNNATWDGGYSMTQFQPMM